MAVYKLFPISDTTLYSNSPTTNAGLDSLLEVYAQNNPTPIVARFLCKFDDEDINEVLNTLIVSSSYSSYLKYSISTAYGLNDSITLETFPLYQSWNNGTGESTSDPIISDGASWGSPLYLNSPTWSLGGIDGRGNKFTSSFNPAYATQGGGTWYTTSSTQGPLLVTQSFSFRSPKDVSIDVTKIVREWVTGSFNNNGFITKLPNNIEFTTSSYNQPILKYYSIDTNTIYPPHLEFRWNDYSTVLTSSYSSSIVDSPKIKLSIEDNKGTFSQGDINRFRVNVSKLYPTRTYQTSSLFINLAFLPEDSHYAVKDLDTNEFVVIFDEQYTKISSDVNGNYFDLYMSGLEPERYYEIVIRTSINGTVKTFNDEFYFKITN
jgi:hypothetical protein